MSRFADAIERLRMLVVAQSALDKTVKEATADVLEAAASQPRSVPPPALVGPQRAPTVADRPPRSAKADESRMAVSVQEAARQREILRTKPVVATVASAQIEKYIKAAWEKATDEASRVHVRDMIHTSIESGSLTDDARERVLALTVQVQG